MVYSELTLLGWRYMVIWECEMKKTNRDLLVKRIVEFMNNK